jgi:thioredoxin reductase
LGPRLPALPLLPRLGGARPADRRARNRPGSTEHAQLLRQWSDDVTFLPHTYSPSAEENAALTARGIQVVEGLVARLSISNDHLEAVELADGRLVPCAAVFIRPALRGHEDGLAESLGCDLDEAGLVRVDASGRTTAPGVWAAGNVTNPRAQVITAAGEGSAAAIVINADLVDEDISRLL